MQLLDIHGGTKVFTYGFKLNAVNPIASASMQLLDIHGCTKVFTYGFKLNAVNPIASA